MSEIDSPICLNANPLWITLGWYLLFHNNLSKKRNEESIIITIITAITIPDWIFRLLTTIPVIPFGFSVSWNGFIIVFYLFMDFIFLFSILFMDSLLFILIIPWVCCCCSFWTWSFAIPAMIPSSVDWQADVWCPASSQRKASPCPASLHTESVKDLPKWIQMLKRDIPIRVLCTVLTRLDLESYIISYLVGGFKHLLIFHHIWYVILPIDSYFFKMVIGTTNQVIHRWGWGWANHSIPTKHGKNRMEEWSCLITIQDHLLGTDVVNPTTNHAIM